MKKFSILFVSCLLAVVVLISSCGEERKTLIHIDYVTYYETPEELIEAVDVVYIGKVVDISFEIWDHGSNMIVTEKLSKDPPDGERVLYTVYHIDVTESYKGNATGRVKFRVQGGIEDYQEKEQKKLLREKTEDRPISIPVLEPSIECKIGSTYLFALSQSQADAHTVLNHRQAVYSMEDSGAEDLCRISADDVLSIFEKQDR